MELSLLSITAPTTPVAGSKEADVSASDGGLYSFENWLKDNGIQDGAEASGESALATADYYVDLVPNLVLAQGAGGTLTQEQILRQLTGVDAVDAVSLSSLSLSKSQAEKLSELMQKYLQRQDVQASLGESQRGLMQQIIDRLQKVTDAGQPLAPVLKPLTQLQGVAPADARERGPIIGQMMKWLKQVLRESVPVRAAAPVVPVANENDALVQGVALAGFPSSADSALAPQEGAQEDKALSADGVPIIVIPFNAALPEKAVPKDMVLAERAPVKAAVDDEGLTTLSDVDASDVPRAASQTASQRSGISLEVFADALAVANTDVSPDLVSKVVANVAQQSSSGDRMIGGATKNDSKIQSLSAVHEKALLQANSLQAVKAALEATRVDMSVTPSGQFAADSSAVPSVVPLTASGFQVGQSNIASSTPASSHVFLYANAQVAVPDQVQIAVRQAKADGMQRITIQLQPEELGRIDVRLDINNEGRAHITFTVDKADTFDQLQRDARLLEKAMQDAGVQTDAGSMEFNLRQQSSHTSSDFGQNSHGGSQGAGEQFMPDFGNPSDAQMDTDAAVDEKIATYSLNADSGVDIRV